jgi:hypothetical protein
MYLGSAVFEDFVIYSHRLPLAERTQRRLKEKLPTKLVLAVTGRIRLISLLVWRKNLNDSKFMGATLFQA